MIGFLCFVGVLNWLVWLQALWHTQGFHFREPGLKELAIRGFVQRLRARVQSSLVSYSGRSGLWGLVEDLLLVVECSYVYEEARSVLMLFMRGRGLGVGGFEFSLCAKLPRLPTADSVWSSGCYSLQRQHALTKLAYP